MRPRVQWLTLVPSAIIIVIGFAVIFLLSGFLERNRAELPAGFEDSDLAFRGSTLKGYACGAEGLIADWYWMRALQYIGDKLVRADDDQINIDDMRNLNPRLLYPYLDTATDLDPGYIAAYTYGAIVLPAIDPEKAIILTNKGIAANPSEWRLYQYLGYIYWRLGRYDKATETYARGAEIPGAAPFMRLMAASMITKGGSRETARLIYRQMLSDAQDEQTAITATRRLKELASLDERDAIDKVLAGTRESTGRCANSLGEVLPLLRGVQLPEGQEFHLDGADRLVDPTGAPYLLDKENCRVKLDPARTGLPLQ